MLHKIQVSDFFSKKKKKTRKTRTPALKGNPQKKGNVLKTFIMSPKKPNSAKRKVARVRLSTGRRVFSYIHGESTRESQPVLKMHADVLVIGGRSRDLPGLRYKMIRGVYDFGPLYIRKTSRSKYGKKKDQKKVD
jgi:small subunit ribosomal protein S12